MSSDSAPYATGSNFDHEVIMNKENLITQMPKLFGQNSSKDREEFSRPTSAGSSKQFSRPQSSMMRGAQKTRGLASRPTTANITRSTTSMSGGKLVSQNGDAFIMLKPEKATGYKKYPKAKATNFVSTTKSSFTDPSSTLRGKKKLEPYRPESARSRLPVRFKGEPKPFTRHCQAGNVSQFHIGAPDAHWENWKKKVVSKRKRPVSAV